MLIRYGYYAIVIATGLHVYVALVAVTLGGIGACMLCRTSSRKTNVGTSRLEYPSTYFKSILGEFCVDLAAFEA